MEALATLAAQIGVPAIVVILLIRELKPLINGKKNDNSPSHADLRDQHAEIMRQSESRDNVLFRKMDEQTRLLAESTKNQAVMIEKLSNLKGRQS